MPQLSAGTRFSHYRITSFLGAGGMGEVYEAYDETLERLVAIKILSAPREGGEEALRRFTREAKAASSLNHPGIVTVFEIGQATIAPDDKAIHFIAMELIRGATLSTVILGGADLTTALGYMEQVAEALAKAHAAGLVHRDLKPENIMVSTDGFAKILDFGLAKPLIAESPGDQSVTQVQRERLTQEGAIVGTVGYIPPEQILGRAVDARSDVFSLGCILYEVATGRHPFRGGSAIETLHKIAYEDPLPMDRGSPPELQRIIFKALAKEPERRYQSAKELAVDLREIRRLSEPAIKAGRPRARSRGWWMGAALVGLAILSGLAALLARSSRSEPSIERTSFESMTVQQIPGTANAEEVSISPDGKYVAYADRREGGTAIVVRQLSSGSEIVVAPLQATPHSEVGFSRDSELVRYQKAGALFQVPVLGGQAKEIASGVSGPFSLSPDEKSLALVRDDSLFVIDLATGAERLLARGSDRNYFVRPAWSPRGELIACSRRDLRTAPPRMLIDLVPAAGGPPQPLPLGDTQWYLFTALSWLADGSALVVSGSQVSLGERQIWQMPYPSGRPRRITNDLHDYLGSSMTADSSALASLQADGRFSVWSAPIASVESRRRIVDGVGPVYSVEALREGRFAYSARVQGNIDIWSSRLDGSDRVRLTDHPEVDANPTVSPDGRTIAFTSMRSGHLAIWTMNHDGSNQKQLTSGPWDTLPNFSPDGAWISYVSRGSGARFLARVPRQGGPAVKLTSPLETMRYEGAVSPDGRLIATSSDSGMVVASAADGRTLRSFPVKGEGMTWSPDSRSILYKSINALYRQDINESQPEKLLDFEPDELSAFTISHDGWLIWVRKASHRAAVIIKNFR